MSHFAMKFSGGNTCSQNNIFYILVKKESAKMDKNLKWRFNAELGSCPPLFTTPTWRSAGACPQRVPLLPSGPGRRPSEMAAAAAAALPRAPAQRTDRTPGMIEALFTLFDEKKWTALPKDTTLKEDPEAKRVVENMFAVKVKRSQVAYQFANWKKFGTSAASVSS